MLSEIVYIIGEFKNNVVNIINNYNYNHSNSDNDDIDELTSYLIGCQTEYYLI